MPRKKSQEETGQVKKDDNNVLCSVQTWKRGTEGIEHSSDT